MIKLNGAQCLKILDFIIKLCANTSDLTQKYFTPFAYKQDYNGLWVDKFGVRYLRTDICSNYTFLQNKFLEVCVN